MCTKCVYLKSVLRLQGSYKTNLMGNQQNYHELVRKVNMYLDNELSKEAERSLLIEIRRNPLYDEVLSKEKSFREFLKSKVHRRKVAPNIIQSIKDKIRLSPAAYTE